MAEATAQPPQQPSALAAGLLSFLQPLQPNAPHLCAWLPRAVDAVWRRCTSKLPSIPPHKSHPCA